MHRISEAEFKQICDDIHRDREAIHALLPNASRRDALFWMVLGCLITLLDVPDTEQVNIVDVAGADPYGDAIVRVLDGRTKGTFDTKIYLDELGD